MTEIKPFSKAPESRRLLRADADGSGALLPESVLSKRKRVMRHGCHRYMARPCLRLMRDPLFSGGNQGGTAIYFVPEADLRLQGFFI